MKVPYSSAKFLLVQIFVGKRPDSSEELFAVFIFAECRTLWPHPYRLMWHLRTVSYELLVFCTVGGWFFFIATIQTRGQADRREPSRSHGYLTYAGNDVINFHLSSFYRSYICGSRSVHENRENCTQRKFPAIGLPQYLLCLLSCERVVGKRMDTMNVSKRTYVAVPNRNRILFHRIFWVHHQVWRAIPLSFR